jgi:hypothetical protein
MSKSGLIRWILDLVVIAMFAYASWSFNQFQRLNKKDLLHTTQLDVLSLAVSGLDASIKDLVDATEKQNEQLGRLVLLATFRTDPWSGKMMLAYHRGWLDWVKEQDPQISMKDMPDVYRIQREYADDLIPGEVLE